MPTLDDFIKRADELVAVATEVLKKYPRNADASAPIPSEAYHYMRTSGMSFIGQVYGEQHTHYRNFERETAQGWDYGVKKAIGILRAVRDELAGGWLVTTRGLVSAEVFSDFLGMADHFLGEGYKDPAAVMIGGVLEEHLRQLSTKHGLPLADPNKLGDMVPRRAARLNDELNKAGGYSPLDHKSVTAWLALRNAAAHSQYSEYTHDQVKTMLDGVTNFIARVPL